MWLSSDWPTCILRYGWLYSASVVGARQSPCGSATSLPPPTHPTPCHPCSPLPAAGPACPHHGPVSAARSVCGHLSPRPHPSILPAAGPVCAHHRPLAAAGNGPAAVPIRHPGPRGDPRAGRHQDGHQEVVCEEGKSSQWERSTHPSFPHLSLSLHTFQAESHELHEIDALCVLDFYVHESTQRQGIGKLLFEV